MFKPFLKWRKISSDLEFLPIGKGYWMTLKYEEKNNNEWSISLVLSHADKAEIKILMAQLEPKINIPDMIKMYKIYASLVVKSL